MIGLFFTTIFIAELIIAGWIISKFIAFNKLVCETNKQVLDFKTKIPEIFNNTRISINSFLLKLNNIDQFVNKKKEECTKILTPNNYIKFISFFLNKDFKKLLVIIDIALAIKKLLKK